ncbi:nitrate reductase subunit beta [Spirochaetia bacterium]|nr:nitrate reductase subunit beta [Spirochaetia bacterium]
MKHLIIGAGAAGIAAARTLLKENDTDTVVMVSEDTEVYSRCMLHRFIAGERSAESINFVNDGLLTNSRFTWISGKTVTRFDAAAKTVYSGDETLASGDTVIIATGSNSVTPPIGDLRSAKNAFGLRHLSDAESIIEWAGKSDKIAVIGAGLVGLDAAAGILALAEKAGRSYSSFHIIEMAPTALAINLDPHAAKPYQRYFEKQGAVFHLGRKVVNTKSAAAGNGSASGNGADGSGVTITGLELDTGEVIPCDMVVMAVGVRPATGFLTDSGVKVERAIVVDDHLMTSVPGVYAAGDVAGLSGIWPNAQKQGETAAKNICGWNLVYDDRFAIKNTVNFGGLVTMSIGALAPQEGDTVLIREDRRVYQKLILRGGVPVGVVLQGDISGRGFWQYLIKNRIPIDKIGLIDKSGLIDKTGLIDKIGPSGKSPWKVSYADFCGLEENGEYKWVV